MPTTLTPVMLGPLERQTLNLVWKLHECCVRDVVVRLPYQRAYTTIMTTLDRLYQKGILNRKKADGKFLYWPRLSQQDLEEAADRQLVSQVLARQRASRELIISSLLETVIRQDSKLFNKIVSSTKAKRRTKLRMARVSRFARGRFQK